MLWLHNLLRKWLGIDELENAIDDLRSRSLEVLPEFTPAKPHTLDNSTPQPAATSFEQMQAEALKEQEIQDGEEG